MAKPNISVKFEDRDILLLLENERLKTFEEWPNDRSWFCTPETLAKAGFHHNPGPDSLDGVLCHFCDKELDGWEPEDDPLQEHKKHSPSCPFLSLRAPVENLTVLEFYRLLEKVFDFKITKAYSTVCKEFENQVRENREYIEDRFEKCLASLS